VARSRPRAELNRRQPKLLDRPEEAAVLGRERLIEPLRQGHEQGVRRRQAVAQLEGPSSKPDGREQVNGNIAVILDCTSRQTRFQGTPDDVAPQDREELEGQDVGRRQRTLISHQAGDVVAHSDVE